MKGVTPERTSALEGTSLLCSTTVAYGSRQLERCNTSISTNAELKVHVSLNVGHQQVCKVVISGTSVKINDFLRSLFIHCAAVELTGIFSDIMNRKDYVRFSDSLVLQPQVNTRSEGYLGHGREGIRVKELWH